MDASLVSKGAETSNRVVEGDIDLYGLGNQILDLRFVSSQVRKAEAPYTNVPP